MPKKATKKDLGKYYQYIIALVGALLLSLSLHAKEKEIPMRWKLWQLGDGMIRVDTVETDTSYINLPMHSVVNDYSIANSYNGNLISPIESKIYFDRLNKTNFLFAQAYQPYILSERDVRFFNTTRPYSYVAYKKGFKQYHEENDIDFGFSGNINPRTNLGVTLNYLSAIGRYASQAGKRFNGAVFGSYNGNNYSLQAAVTFNTLSNFENGGIKNNDSTNYLNTILEKEDYPTRLNGMSAYRYISGFLNHYYSLTAQKERKVTEDSVAIDYIPLITFEHTFWVNQSTKRYVEKNANQDFFAHTYFDPKQTRDSAEMLTIGNTLAVTFEEAYNRLLRFGATVYASNTSERYTTLRPLSTPFVEEPFNNILDLQQGFLIAPENDTLMQEKWTNNTSVGGAIYKKTGSYIRYRVQGDVCVAGYRLGEFSVRGNMDLFFRLGQDTLTVLADAYIKNEQPSYFLQYYRSNHYWWKNDFQKKYRMYVSGAVQYPTKYVQPRVRVSFENLTRHIYFNEEGLPQQHDGNIQILGVDADLNLWSPWFCLENKAVYQKASSALVPLPSISLYHNLYYYGCWFKALDVQIGADLRYNTAYYAPLLNPATGQFCLQDKQKVGNFPIANLYANFYVRSLHLRLFVQWQHFNDLFTKNKIYYSMPDYPYNPSTFRAGLAWSFYN